MSILCVSLVVINKPSNSLQCLWKNTLAWNDIKYFFEKLKGREVWLGWYSSYAPKCDYRFHVCTQSTTIPKILKVVNNLPFWDHFPHFPYRGGEMEGGCVQTIYRATFFKRTSYLHLSHVTMAYIFLSWHGCLFCLFSFCCIFWHERTRVQVQMNKVVIRDQYIIYLYS